MKLELILAGFLAYGPNNGYGLKLILDSEWRFFRKKIHLSQMYRTLNSMEEHGWVTSGIKKRENQPDLRNYSLTNSGFDHLIKWLKSDQSETGFRFQERIFVGKVYFMGFINDPHIVLSQLQNELSLRLSQKEEYRQRDRHIELKTNGFELDQANVWKFTDLVHSYGTGAMDHYIEWLEEIIRKIQQHVDSAK